VQPVVGKACDPGSHRAQLSNRAVGWKRPSIIRLPPPDRSSRPRSCGGVGSSMAAVLGAGINGIKKERNNANTAADLGWVNEPAAREGERGEIAATRLKSSPD